MTSPKVAIVSRDHELRLQAAAAFDSAPAEWQVELHRYPPGDADVVVATSDIEPDVGDVRFDTSDPEDAIDAVARCLSSKSGRVVAVRSATGGVGATTLAIHLAAALGNAQRVCLIEASPRCGLSSRLGCEDPVRWGPDPEVEKAAAPISGLRVLCAPDSAAPDSHGSLGPVCDGASAEYDFVIVDAGCSEVGFQSDLDVVVMTPTRPSAGVTAALIESLHAPEGMVVANRLGPGGEMRLPALQKIVRRSIAMELPCSPSLRDREDLGSLLTSPWSRWWLGVRRIARAIS